ncbi:MAG: hypothetical protein GY820_37820, partial [Gammaproteobacteria bacterium]|nr:hypothetical protein [Gammaproteobacteria bacterium]
MTKFIPKPNKRPKGIPNRTVTDSSLCNTVRITVAETKRGGREVQSVECEDHEEDDEEKEKEGEEEREEKEEEAEEDAEEHEEDEAAEDEEDEEA